MERQLESRGALRHLERRQAEPGQIRRKQNRHAVKKKGQKYTLQRREKNGSLRVLNNKAHAFDVDESVYQRFYAPLKDRELPPSEQKKKLPPDNC